MSEERILITGAAGFVGGHLISSLRQRQPEWRLMCVSSPADPPLDANFPIEDSDAAAAVVQEFRPTKVVHLAAVTTVRATEENPRSAWDINLCGTLNILLPLQKVSPNAQFLLVSSAEVYGLSDDESAITESHPISPTNPYSASKASAELAVLAASYSGLRVVIARPFTHTGPGQSVRFAFPYFASRIVDIERGFGGGVLKVGNLDDHRDVTDVRDICIAYARMLEQSSGLPNRSIFNLASGRSWKMADLLGLMLSQSKIPIVVNVDPQRVRSRTRVLGNADKAAELLNWRPSIPIERTLSDILDHWRSLPPMASHQ